MVDADGQNLRRLTNDRYADLHAGVVARRPHHRVHDRPRPGDGLRDPALRQHAHRALPPRQRFDPRCCRAWSAARTSTRCGRPTAGRFAFVSDRAGIDNLFLYDLGGDVYQLTNAFTGAQRPHRSRPPSRGPARPTGWCSCISRRQYNVYTIDNPRSLKRAPYQPPPPTVAAARPDTAPAPAARPDSAALALAKVPTDTVVPKPDSAPTAIVPGVPQVKEGGSIYRTPTGFRAAAQAPVPTDTARKRAGDMTVMALLDSATLDLPDTTEFTIGPYERRFTPETSARPSVGYTRDNFGNGIYGGGAIQFGDILGDEQIILSAYINGSLNQGDFLVAYANLANRLNWAVGFQQTPTYYVQPAFVFPNTPTPGENAYVQSTRLLTYRSLFGRAFWNMNRFQRIEMGLGLGQIDDAILSYVQYYYNATGAESRQPASITTYAPGQRLMMPSLALVYDATFMGWIGPLFGTRYRLEVARTMGVERLPVPRRF